MKFAQNNLMTDKSWRNLYLIGFPLYLILIVFSQVFFKERTVLLDASYALFHMLKENGFSIEFHRFPDAIVQSMPLIASRYGAGFVTIMRWYSASFVLYYVLAYIVTGFLLKRYDLALIILLINTLFVTDTFYYTPSQLPQGMCFLVIYLAAMQRFLKYENISKALFYILSFLFVLATIVLPFFHPMLLFSVVFVAGYYFLKFDRLNKVTKKTRYWLFILASVYVVVVILKSIFLHTDYEQKSMSGLRNFVKLFPNYITLYSHVQFLLACLGKFVWIPLVFFAVAAKYIYDRNWKRLVFFAVYFIAFLFLINITYPDKTTPAFYIENLYLSFGLFLGLPFVLDVLPVLHRKKFDLIVICALLISFVVRVYARHEIYTARVRWEESCLVQYANRKVVIDAMIAPTDTLMQLWGTPYEFWLLSGAEKGYAASILVDAKPGKLDWLKYVDKGFYVNWMFYPYSEFPHNQYFRFLDTVNKYEFVH